MMIGAVGTLLRSASLLLLVLAATTVAHATDRPAGEVLTMRLDGDVTVDETGAVAAYNIDSEMDPALKPVVDKAVHSWKFKPITMDGKPVRAKTSMRITLAAEQRGDDYVVSVENAVFTNDLAKKAGVKSTRIGKVKEPYQLPDMVPGDDVKLTIAKRGAMPAYPKSGSMNRVEADVLLVVRAAPDGKIIDVIVAQSSLLNVRGSSRSMDQVRDAFEQASIRAFKTWTLAVEASPGAKIDDEALTGTMSVRFKLPSLDFGEKPGVWRFENRSVRRSAPWLPERSIKQRLSVSDFGDGDSLLSGMGRFELLQGDGSGS